MNMQIEAIVIYGGNGQMRKVPLRKGKVNIITGSSKTGKSSLIDIVDYCLGSEECHVPEGVIRQRVTWYGLLLRLNEGQLFIARPDPGPGKLSTVDAFMLVGNNVEVPEFKTLIANTTIGAVVELLTRTTGIRENLHVPKPGQTRDPLEANIRHALLFALQAQGEVANRELLFHKQGKPFVPQAIKDTLPFFLGAVVDDHLEKRQRLRQLRNERRALEVEIGDIEDDRNVGFGRAAALLAEAQAVGLWAPDELAGDVDVTVVALRALTQKRLSDTSEASASDAMARLRNERATLHEEYRRVKDEINVARSVVASQTAFSNEAREQQARLKSITLFQADGDQGGHCPLCESTLNTLPPSVNEIQQSLAELSVQLLSAAQDVPRVQGMVDALSERLARTKARLNDNRVAIDALEAQDATLLEARDSHARQAHVLGRISLYLENVRKVEDTTELKQKVSALVDRIEALEDELRDETVQEKIASILNIIGTWMSKWSSHLQLEHSESPIRIDLSRLTVVADTPRGPIPMDRMGSGENWVGYHLLAHLGLHRWFVEKGRPVPRLLFLDQPTQVYYPAEKDVDGSLNVLVDEDRKAVVRIFKLILAVAEKLSPGFQVVITDHADIKEDWFQDAVVERWRGGNKLVPADWKNVAGR